MMKKQLAAICTLVFVLCSTVQAFAVEPVKMPESKKKAEHMAWALNEYDVSRVIYDPGDGVAVRNEADLIATGTMADSLRRADGWKAYHGNNSKGIPYGRLTNGTPVTMWLYAMIDYSNGEAIMHTDSERANKTDYTYTVSLVDGGAGAYGSGKSQFFYHINGTQVHKSTSPLPFTKK